MKKIRKSEENFIGNMSLRMRQPYSKLTRTCSECHHSYLFTLTQQTKFELKNTVYKTYTYIQIYTHYTFEWSLTKWNQHLVLTCISKYKLHKT